MILKNLRSSRSASTHSKHALIAIAAAIGLALTGCADGAETGDDQGSKETQSVNFVTPFGYLVGFAPVLVSESDGTFASNGLDAKIQGGSGSAQAVQQVVSGQALLSRTGGIDLMKAVANESADIVAVGTIDYGSPFNVVSSSKNPIKNAGDMEGKTIGVVSPNGATENILDVMLSEAGVDPDSVEREIVSNAPGTFSMVEKGTIDAYISTISTVVALQQDGSDMEYWSTDKVAPIPGQVYIAKKSTLEENRTAIVAFLKSVDATINGILAPDGYEKTYPELQKYEIAGIDDKELSIASLKAESELWTSEDGKILVNIDSEWTKGAELMASADLIESADTSDFYTNDYVEEALK